MDEYMRIVREAGFETAAPLDVTTIKLMDEVRAMCSSGSCGMYGKNWACPPACGSLEDCRTQVAGYTRGILVQTVGDVEDSMDIEGMMEAEAEHKKRFLETAEKLRAVCPDLLPLGSGTCTLCRKCAYPEAPCRFPEKRISSMEAYGILVNDICTQNNVKYYYGPEHIAYTACYLFP